MRMVPQAGNTLLALSPSDKALFRLTIRANTIDHTNITPSCFLKAGILFPFRGAIEASLNQSRCPLSTPTFQCLLSSGVAVTSFQRTPRAL